MIFSSSTNGISHAKEEDTPIEHLELALQAFGMTAERVIRAGGARPISSRPRSATISSTAIASAGGAAWRGRP